MLNFKNRPRCRQLPVTTITTTMGYSYLPWPLFLPHSTPSSLNSQTSVYSYSSRDQNPSHPVWKTNNFQVHFLSVALSFGLTCDARVTGASRKKERKMLLSSSLTDMILWTSAGCYFNLITPCQFCCTHSSLDRQNPAGGITDWIQPLLIWLTGSDKTFQSSSSLTETLEPNNWGALLQEGSGGRV